MKQKITIFVLSIFATILNIQAQKDYKGIVLDKETGEPIPYVNIGIVEKGLGTVTDEEGLFHLMRESSFVEPDDIVLFSALGYAPLNIPLAEMPLLYNEYTIFKMTPQRMALNEVVVSNKGTRFIDDFIGYRNYGEKSFGYWKDQIAFGGELATRIVAKSGLRRLNRFQFEVIHNPSDSLLLRVNVYDDDGVLGQPNTNLNTSGKSILVTVKNTDKIVWVDLKPFDVYVKDDFLISLELLKVYGNKKLGLVLAASTNRFGSFRKYASQDNWEYVDDANMAFYLETQLLVSEKMAQRFEKREAKKKKKLRMISGFTIDKGKMISGVEVLNERTKDKVVTDKKGRYFIAADKKDKIYFKKEGYQIMLLTVSDKPTANIIMKGE